MQNTTRILVVRFSSIGDIVLTTPIIRCLKEQLEGQVELHYLCKKGYAGMLETNPYVDHVIGLDGLLSSVYEEISSKDYDYVIDLHHNLRSLRVRKHLSGLSFKLDKRNLAKWLYVQTKREILPIGHIVERMFDTVSPLGISNDGRGLDYFIPESQVVDSSALPTAHQAGYVAYAIGGQMQGKILPTEKIISLCQKINSPMMLLGGPEDAERGDEIVAALGDRIWNACGKFSLDQSASLVQNCKKLITHDTGLMHIGAALQKPIISLWFATTPQIGMSPWQPSEGSKIIEADCPKRPTSKLGNKGYEDGCVFNIDLDAIAQEVNT